MGEQKYVTFRGLLIHTGVDFWLANLGIQMTTFVDPVAKLQAFLAADPDVKALL